MYIKTIIYFISHGCEKQMKILENSIHFHYVVISALPKGPEPIPRGHAFHNLGRGLHEYYNHAFSLSSPAVNVEKISLIYNTCLTIWPYPWFKAWTSDHGTMNFTISVQEFMDIVAKHLVLSKMNMEVEKDFRRFNTFHCMVI